MDREEFASRVCRTLEARGVEVEASRGRPSGPFDFGPVLTVCDRHGRRCAWYFEEDSTLWCDQGDGLWREVLLRRPGDVEELVNGMLS